MSTLSSTRFASSESVVASAFFKMETASVTFDSEFEQIGIKTKPNALAEKFKNPQKASEVIRYIIFIIIFTTVINL